MFSYGSGCAASLFVLRFDKQYKKIATACEFKYRLAQRIKVTPTEYDAIMAHRQSMFGKNDYTPTVSLNNFTITLHRAQFLSCCQVRFIQLRLTNNSNDTTQSNKPTPTNQTLKESSNHPSLLKLPKLLKLLTHHLLNFDQVIYFNN